MTFNGQTTAALAYNITAANLQTALQALSSIGTGNVTVATGPNAYSYVLTFAGTLAYADQPLVTVNASGLTPTTAPGHRRNGARRLRPEQRGPDRRLRRPYPRRARGPSPTTAKPPRAWPSTSRPTPCKRRWKGCPRIGAGNVKVWLGANAYTYLVAFQGALAGVDAALLDDQHQHPDADHGADHHRDHPRRRRRLTPPA